MNADEELTAALTHFTAERLGLTLLYLVEAVARTHPGMLREALGRVFDLTLYEEEARKAAANLGRLHDEALALRRELRELRQQLAELERYRPGPTRNPGYYDSDVDDDFSIDPQTPPP